MALMQKVKRWVLPVGMALCGLFVLALGIKVAFMAQSILFRSLILLVDIGVASVVVFARPKKKEVTDEPVPSRI